MGTYNSTMRIEQSHASNSSNKRDNSRRSAAGQTSKSTLTSMSMSAHAHAHSHAHSPLMGNKAPPLYEAALVGNWNDVMSRLKTHPNEAFYLDKSKNTPLHLVCRRQPPVDVVKALLNCNRPRTAGGGGSTSAANNSSGDNNGNAHGNNNAMPVDQHAATNLYAADQNHNSGGSPPRGGNGGGCRESLLHSTTVDGLTALHFACYCGADPQVINLLLGNMSHASSSSMLSSRSIMSSSRSVASTFTTMSSSRSIGSASHSSAETAAAAAVRRNRSITRIAEEHAYMRRSKPRHATDRRGRTPLHCACAGFRTPHRPAVIHSLLKKDPHSATMADEKGRTAFSLLYDDYAEEVEDVIGIGLDGGLLHARNMHVGYDHVRELCLKDGGSLVECWKILVLLLKASSLGYVEDDYEQAVNVPGLELTARDRKGNKSKSKSKSKSEVSEEEEKKHGDNDVLDRSSSVRRKGSFDSNASSVSGTSSNRSGSVSGSGSGSSRTLRTSMQSSKNGAGTGTGTAGSRSSSINAMRSSANSNEHDYINQVDLSQERFQLIHAAAATLYTFPHGFFRLLLKVCGVDCVKEHDVDFHLPLHLAAKATPPPTSPSLNVVNQNRYSISTSFHGQSSTVYEKLGVTVSYYPDPSQYKKNKQYATTSFQPTEAFGMQQTPIISHLLDIYPDAAGVPDDHGKYPILLAIESGKTYEYAIQPLLDAYPSLLFGRGASMMGLEGLQDDMHGNIMSHGGLGLRDPGDINASAGIEAIQASLMNGLTDPSIRVRNETAATVGHLIKRIRNIVKDPIENIRSNLNPEQFKTDEFLRNIIRTSGRYGSVNARVGQNNSSDSNHNNTSCNNEWTGIQATMLQALSAALSNMSPGMIQIPETPQLALDVASNMLKHEDCTVRECAAHCIGAALELLGEEVVLGVVTRAVLPQRRNLSVNMLQSSIHSELSVESSKSTKSTSSISSIQHLISDTSNAALLKAEQFVAHKAELKIYSDNLKLVKMEEAHNRHGRALACFRILTSSKGDFVTVNDSVFQEATHLMQSLMLDEAVIVREAACLAMGAILGLCADTPGTLKKVRNTLLKCMRTTEEVCVQIALARGLMVATRMKPHVFVCKSGTAVLEGALLLAVSSVSPINVQKMYHGFLWLALGIGDKESAHYGLSEYMSLAEGENGKIMMSLVTKNLAKIESVRDILWSSTVYCEEEIDSAYV